MKKLFHKDKTLNKRKKKKKIQAAYEVEGKQKYNSV